MSAPQTNIERQKRRHKGPLIGMIAAVVLALGLFFAFTIYTAQERQTPGVQTPGVTTPSTDGPTGLPVTE